MEKPPRIQSQDAINRAAGPEATVAVVLSRTGPTVTLTLTCSDHYASIDLYERLLQSIKTGHLQLDLGKPQ